MSRTPPSRPTREDFKQALSDMGTYIDVTVDDLMEITTMAERHARQREAEAYRVDTLMSQPLVTVRTDTSLAEAAHEMVTRRISGLPVVDADNRLVGILTEADMLRALGVPSHHPTHNLWQTLEAMFTHAVRPQSPEGSVAALMVTDLVTIRPDQTLHDVLELMKRHRIKRLVVTNDKGEPIGMITRSDIVRVFFDRIRGQE
ncbi:CBS domain-containing protein [Thiohalobacter thiocyanaticus]|uniref:CBS domain-containing protein n=1 Tax=Thiohalobacter thiocyanaticus TaxID=585455 RepID=A0A426QH56_9GAMM|nr:CBS domain-containing protein [Thiohalobacter thiocyanaticus]RRQ21056.1 CBS domain-containing protein [Thiohalobacter thiocyanaticus]